MQRRLWGADVYGRPCSGRATGQLDLAERPFPSPGNCEPATATLRVTDAKTMQRFQGRYVITSANQRGLVGTVGHLELRLLGGEVSVTAVQS